MSEVDGEGATAVTRAFGAENRARLLERYFEQVSEPVRPETAWRHIYRLLMWIDRTIGLAHCYESDKCQPGRPWYARSLAFHHWLSNEFDVPPSLLSDDIDWLFSAAVRDLSASAEITLADRLSKAERQRAAFVGHDMPVPGEDPELESLITSSIIDTFGVQPSPDFVRELSNNIRTYVGSENKRKNLVGEGFEDTLACILRRWNHTSRKYDIFVRPALHDLPGFHRPRGGDKTKKVDLALVDRTSGRRVLVSCKWSVRSDREEQFSTDFEAYSKLESEGATFDYVLVTNEFDPARLAAACDNRSGNAEIFTHVVHMNPDALLTVFNAPVSGRRTGSGIERTIAHIDSGRLCSIEHWLRSIGGQLSAGRSTRGT